MTWPSARSAHQQSLTKTVQALGGIWDAQRAVTALRDAGHQVDDKRARDILRRLALAGLIEKTHGTRAIYRTTGQ